MRELARQLASTPADDARAEGLAELEELIAEAQATFDELGNTRGRALLPALYRACSTRAEFDRHATVEQREEWIFAAREFARSWGDSEAIVRAGLLHAALWSEAGRVLDALELSRELLIDHPDAKLRPFVLFQCAKAAVALGDSAAAFGALDDLEQSTDPEPWAREILCQAAALRAMAYNGIGVPDQAARFVREGERCLAALPSVGTNNAILMAIQVLNLDLARARYDAVVERVTTLLEDTTLYPERSPWRGTLLCILGQASIEGGANDGLEPLEQALGCTLAEPDRLRAEALLARQRLERGDMPGATLWMGRAEERLREWRAVSGARGSIPEELLVATVALHCAIEGRDEGDRSRCESFLRGALDDRMAAWRELSPVRRGGSGFLHDVSTRSAVAELLRCAARDPRPDVGAEHAFRILWEVQALGTLARELGAPRGSLEIVRDRLLEQERGLLVYFPGPTESIVFELDSFGAHVHLLPDAETIESLRAALGRALVGNDRPRITAAREALSQALFPPGVRAAVGRWTGGLTIVGAELFSDLPFSMLDAGAGSPLGVARALSFLPSMPLGVLLSERAPDAQSHDALVLAAPRLAAFDRERFPELEPFDWPSERELGWDFHPPGGRLRFLTGSEASLAGLRSALGGVRVLQFVAHCVRDERLERPATLALSGVPGASGLLTCDAIEGLEAVPELVLLTACRSSYGPVRRGDDVSAHLGGAFLRAGARTVVLSEEDLELETAQRLSSTMHEALFAHGCSPAEALRRALERELERDPGSRPRGLRLAVLGLGHEPLFPAPRSNASPAAPLAGGPRHRLLSSKALYFALIALLLGGIAGRMRKRSP